MLVYLDESGDLGWKFDLPYRHGGSSRYLTIAMLLLPEDSKQFPRRVIKDFYQKNKFPKTKEVKGSELNLTQENYFTTNVIKLLNSHPEINLLSITVNKKNVQPHIREDGNKIYNYMISLALLDPIKNESNVTLIPDPRSIKVKSGNSMIDYLQTKLWFDMNVNTRLRSESIPSDKCDNLKFIDIITHIIWSYFEKGNNRNYQRLSPYIHSKTLYFH